MTPTRTTGTAAEEPDRAGKDICQHDALEGFFDQYNPVLEDPTEVKLTETSSPWVELALKNERRSFEITHRG